MIRVEDQPLLPFEAATLLREGLIMAVHITVTRRDGGVERSDLKVFEDHQKAANWLVQDSYFQNYDVVKVVYEVFGCLHVWDFHREPLADEHPMFCCKLCGAGFLIEASLINEMFKKSQG